MANQTTVWAQTMLGQTLKGQYSISGILGEGAMGVVFRGVNLAMDKAVAIKMMRKEAFDTPDAVERFNREARVWSQLNHPAITQVFDFGLHAGQAFLVMELVEGVDLSEVIKREKLIEPLRAVKLVRQLAGALEEAHRLGVVHRDIKPANIKLLRYQPGGKVIVKVLDFGMAKQLGKVDQRLTAPGMLVGTPKYVAPEQITENPHIDGRTDLYATGVLFYEILTGAAPFLGSPHEVLLAHLGSQPAPLPGTVPQIVQDVVMRLLRKRPDERFPNAAALEQALEECEFALRTAGAPSYSSGSYTPQGMSSNSYRSQPPSAASVPTLVPSSQSLRSAAGGAPSARSESAIRSQPTLITPPSARSQSSAKNRAPSAQSQPTPSARSQSSAKNRVPSAQSQPTPSARSQSSAKNRVPGSSQPSASSQPTVISSSSGLSLQGQGEATRGSSASRVLLGALFACLMLGSGALFYGLRHHLPLQRFVAELVPAFTVPQDEEVDKELRSLAADRDRRQWAMVLRGVQFLEQRYAHTLLPEQSEALAGLRKKAEFEAPLQDLYEKLIVAATRPDAEEVMRLYSDLPGDSVYRPLAQPYYDAALESFVATHLSKAEELRLSGRCSEYLSEVQKLLAAVPGHPQARAAEQKECPPTAAGGDLGTAPAPAQP